MKIMPMTKFFSKENIGQHVIILNDSEIETLASAMAVHCMQMYLSNNKVPAKNESNLKEILALKNVLVEYANHDILVRRKKGE